MPVPTTGQPQAIAGILLVGGESQRFGGDKLVQRLPDGVPMAVAAARCLLAVCPHSLAVLRPQQGELAELLLATGMQVRIDAGVAAGIGSSLASAVRATAQAAGWLVALGDMPFIQPSTMRLVADALANGAAIAAPRYGGQRGHPVGFAACWFPHLASLAGDVGGRELIASHAELVVHLDVDDAGSLHDVDRQSDLGRHASPDGEKKAG